MLSSCQSGRDIKRGEWRRQNAEEKRGHGPGRSKEGGRKEIGGEADEEMEEEERGERTRRQGRGGMGGKG